MDERTIIQRLSIIARDELTFLQKGYDDPPDYVQQETKELLASINWLSEKEKALGDKHTGSRS